MMKKVLLGLIAAAAMTGCIKREDSLATDQASNLSSGTISGTYWVKTDYVGDTLPNGATDFDLLGVSPWEGLVVTATYNTNNLDPNNVNGEQMVVTTTTDANGEYTLTIPATGNGTFVTVEVDGVANVDVFHDVAGRCEIDPNTFEVIPQTESLRFSVNDSYTTTITAGEAYTRDIELYEADIL